MQDWVFDRDGARTGRDPGATAEQPTLRAPADPPPRRRRLGRRGRRVVAAGAALAVLTGGVAVAATSEDTAPVAAAAEESPVSALPQTPQTPQTPQAVPRTATPPDAAAPEDGTSEEGTTEDDTATAPSAPWSVLHEERQLQQRDGTVLTVALQGGTVTGLTADSVTVASADGFTSTYAVTTETRIATPSGTLADLASGDAVLVEAVVEGDTATAVTIRTAPTTADGDTPDATNSTEQSATGTEA